MLKVMLGIYIFGYHIRWKLEATYMYVSKTSINLFQHFFFNISDITVNVHVVNYDELGTCNSEGVVTA